MFDDIYLRPAGYSSPGWKKHVSNTLPADIYAQVDDDPFAGHAVLKTPIPGRQKVAYIVNNGLAVNHRLMERAAVQNPSGLSVVKTVSQALAGIANLR